MNRTQFLHATGVAGAALLVPRGAQAADFPGGKTIELVSWSAAGSPKDVMARQVAKALGKIRTWQVIVEDRVGGDGAVAMNYLLSKPPDGLTLIAASGSMDIALQTDLKEQFKPTDFAFVSQIQSDPFVLAVASNAPYKSVKDLATASAGAPLSVGAFGADSEEHLVALKIANAAQLHINYVPFGGGSEALTALLGGNVAATILNGSQALPQVISGKLRVLGVTTARPVPGLSAPTFASMGYRDLVHSLWRGFVARGGTPDATVATLSEAFGDLTKDPDYVAYCKEAYIAISYLPAQQFKAAVVARMAEFQRDLPMLGHS